MLFLKHIIIYSLQGRCNVKCSVNNSTKKEKSLQARVEEKCLHKKSRASCFDSCQASVTVEASLVFPIFLCALVCFISLAQMVLIETEVYHAMSQTAKVYAKQQMVHFISEISEEQRQGNAGRISGSGNARGTFFLIYDGSSLCENIIEGGRRGIKISSSLASGQTVRLKAEYTLKMTIPFFPSIRFRKKAVVKRRIFSGYIKHQGETDDMGENSIVYVAENGVVYHKNASCSHICLKISGSKRIQDILHSSKYNACEKCIYKGVTPSVLFVTTYGDCYHSSLTCSGLKRTIRAVRLNDVGGLRPCSRCAS